MSPSSDNGPANIFVKIWRAIVGAPKEVKDPHLFHKMSLIPILAWVGLGADGLSSSAYGPEEAFRALGSHTYLAPDIATAKAEFYPNVNLLAFIGLQSLGSAGFLTAASRTFGVGPMQQRKQILVIAMPDESSCLEHLVLSGLCDEPVLLGAVARDGQRGARMGAPDPR